MPLMLLILLCCFFTPLLLYIAAFADAYHAAPRYCCSHAAMIRHILIAALRYAMLLRCCWRHAVAAAMLMATDDAAIRHTLHYAMFSLMPCLPPIRHADAFSPR